MKKFLEEFKEFALKGNVMSLAIGVIIGGAFQSLVTAFTDCFITPIINSIGGAEIGGHFQIFHTGQYIEYGAFISAVINFIIMAFVIFVIMKGINAIMDLGKKKVPLLYGRDRYQSNKVYALYIRCSTCSGVGVDILA
mgnify:CR=1 FL=1